jgi:hypothetical protein
LPEEAENPTEDYRGTKNGNKLHQTLLILSRALESCENNSKRRDEIGVYDVHLAFAKASNLINAQRSKTPAKGGIKSSFCYVLQKFIKTSMIQSLIAAVRMDERSKHSDYVIKTHSVFLVRELSAKGDDKIEGMLGGYVHQLLKRFADHDFKFALESLYVSFY